MFFICMDRVNMAKAEAAYVYDGPNVQYDAQAIKGPKARPSCPDERN